MAADINDLIAGGIKPPAVEDLATAKAKQLTLGNLAQQQQLGKQQLAEGALTLAQKQRDDADERAINDAMAANTTNNPDGSPKLDRDGVINQLNQGGHGIAAGKVQAQFTAQDTSHAKQIEAQNTAATSALTLTNQRAVELAKLSQAVEDAPPERKQDAYTNLHTEGLRLGLITPAMQAQFPAQYDPSQDQHLHALTLAAQDAKTRSDLATANLTRTKDQATIDADAQKLADTWRVSAASQASVALNQQDLDGIRARLAASGAPPAALKQIPATYDSDALKELGRAAMTVEQRVQADQAAANAAETASRDRATQLNEQAMRTQGAQRLAQEADANNIRRVAADPFGALGLNKNPQAGAPAKPGAPALTGAPFLATLPPAMATRVSHIASGAETLTAREKGSPTGQGLMAAVEQFDPAWSEQRGQLRKAFTSGPDGRNIGNLNTAPVHLAQLADASAAMQNGSFVPGNRLFNSVVQTFGGSAPTNFNGMKTVVAGEMAAAMKGNATDPEIAAFNKSVDAASSPGQLADVIQKVFMPALATKLQTYNERYHAQSGADDPWSPVLPSAKAAFARFGIGAPGASGLPPEAKAQLREGQDTTFGNGQIWTLRNGKETQVK